PTHRTRTVVLVASILASAACSPASEAGATDRDTRHPGAVSGAAHPHSDNWINKLEVWDPATGTTRICLASAIGQRTLLTSASCIRWRKVAPTNEWAWVPLESIRVVVGAAGTGAVLQPTSGVGFETTGELQAADLALLTVSQPLPKVGKIACQP